MIVKIKKGGKKFLEFAESTINKIENSDTPFYFFIFIFLVIIQLRNLLEDFSGSSGLGLEMHIHFTLFYISIILLILLVVKIFTKNPILKSFKVFSLYFSFVLLGPIIDIISSGLGRSNISYLFPRSFNELITQFFTFFGEYTIRGPTPGIKIHLFIILSLLFIYVFIKTNKNLIKSLTSTIIVYIFIFVWFITPSILEKILSLTYEDGILSLYFFIISFILLMILFYLSNKNLFKIVVQDIRPPRVIYFNLLFILGVIVGYKEFGFLPKSLILIIPLLVICIILAWTFSVVTNNFADYNIDKISNKNRPLFKKDLVIKDYKNFGIICLVLSLFGAGLVGYQGFLFIFLFIGNYFIYSMPPIRFKKYPIISKLTISLNSLFLVFLGYSLFLLQYEIFYFSTFPTNKLIFLLPFALAANFIDIKDYEGDKKEGIKTLPVLLGLKNGKRVIAIFFALPYLFLSYSDPSLFIWCVPFIIINSLIILEKNYNEKKLFLVILISILLYTVKIFIS